MNKKVPINQAEAICMPLFDMNISNINEFSLIEECRSDGCFFQSWDSCVINSYAEDFTLVWKGSLYFEAYDALRFFINYSERLLLSGKAIVNGKEHILFTNVPGGNAPVEPTSKPLVNKGEEAEITGFELTFHYTGNFTNKHNVNLYWVGLLSTEDEKLIEEQLPKFDESSWKDFINKDGKPWINNNLFFTEQELALMKSRINEPFFKPMRDKLKEDATKWKNFSPEKEIREYVPVVENSYRYTRIRDRNRVVLYEPIITLAIAGYFFDNPEWTQMAARMILSVVHSPKWFEGPQAGMEGSTWHHVSFTEEDYISAIAIAMGFMGDVFTLEGIQKILDAFEKPWEVVNRKCEEHGYRWYMNQGIVGNNGRIVGAYFFYKNGRGYEEYIERSYKDHTAIVNNYLNEEGHCTEGGYYQYSFSKSVTFWLIYANYKGVEIGSILPERFVKSIKYVEAMMSSNNRMGYIIPLGAGGYRPFDMLLLAFIASVCRWDKALYYIKNRMQESVYNNIVMSGTDMLILLKFLPKDIPEAELTEKGLNVFKDGGLMAYRFNYPYKGKLMFLCERNPLTGHYHEDRGSIILEANGKTLLLDLGTTNYSNSMCAFMGNKEYHNLAYPDGMSSKIINPKAKKSANEAGVGCTTVITSDDFTYPGPKLEYAEETDVGVEFGGDLKPLYDDEVKAARRDGALVLHDLGGVLTLKDRWKFAGKCSLNVNYLSNSPWIIKDNSARSTVDDINMTIEFTEKYGGKLSFCQDDVMIDSNLNKVYTLRIKAEPAENVEIWSKVNFVTGEYDDDIAKST